MEEEEGEEDKQEKERRRGRCGSATKQAARLFLRRFRRRSAYMLSSGCAALHPRNSACGMPPWLEETVQPHLGQGRGATPVAGGVPGLAAGFTLGPPLVGRHAPHTRRAASVAGEALATALRVLLLLASPGRLARGQRWCQQRRAR